MEGKEIDGGGRWLVREKDVECGECGDWAAPQHGTRIKTKQGSKREKNMMMELTADDGRQ
jgi:hypothetical protein